MSAARSPSFGNGLPDADGYQGKRGFVVMAFSPKFFGGAVEMASASRAVIWCSDFDEFVAPQR